MSTDSSRRGRWTVQKQPYYITLSPCSCLRPCNISFACLLGHVTLSDCILEHQRYSTQACLVPTMHEPDVLTCFQMTIVDLSTSMNMLPCCYWEPVLPAKRRESPSFLFISFMNCTQHPAPSTKQSRFMESRRLHSLVQDLCCMTSIPHHRFYLSICMAR